MRGKWTPGFLVVFALACLSCAVAQGQEQPKASQQRAQGNSVVSDYPETDIGGSFFGSLLSSSTHNGITQTPQNGLGAMFEVRHLINPMVGFELSYGFGTEGKQTIAPAATSCGYVCNLKPFTDTVKDNLITVAWVFSKQYGRLRPFALAGPGIYLAVAGNSVYGVNNPERLMLVAGGGVDYFVTQHWGVRAQFRGNFFAAPDLSTQYPSSGARTHIYQPAGGFFYAF